MKAILERDFFQFAKRKRYYSMRTLAVALPLGILLLAMSVADLRDDQLGEFVFATTAWPIVCFAALLSPGMTAGLLVEERRDNRLDVLRSTPMAAWQIVVGRWFSRVALLWTMILAALPWLAAPRPIRPLRPCLPTWRGIFRLRAPPCSPGRPR